MWTDPGWFVHLLEVRICFFILGCTTSNVLYLCFSTLYSSSFWRTDTIVFVKLKKAPSQISPTISIKPPANVFEMNKPPPGGLIKYVRYVTTFSRTGLFLDRVHFRALFNAKMEAPLRL